MVLVPFLTGGSSVKFRRISRTAEASFSRDAVMFLLEEFLRPGNCISMDFAQRTKVTYVKQPKVCGNDWVFSIWKRHSGRNGAACFFQMTFEKECLVRIADTFQIACGDFAFYRFPTRTLSQKLFGQLPPILFRAFA